MSPAALGSGELLWRILRVIDENIRPRRKFPQTLVHFFVSRFVIGGINDGPRGCLDAETQAPLRMIQRPGGDLILSDEKSIAASHFLKPALGVHRRHVHWKI